MRLENMEIHGSWQDVADAAYSTEGKRRGGRIYPGPDWKKAMLLAEHSPIRRLRVSWRWVDLPYWVSVQMVRHKIGIEHFVSTQRTDRTGRNRDELPQSAPVIHAAEANAQALINISRKRLCSKASEETRRAWALLVGEIRRYDDILASVMVPECAYRGFCPEREPCGRAQSEDWGRLRRDYVNWREAHNCFSEMELAELGYCYDVARCRKCGRTWRVPAEKFGDGGEIR